MTRSKVIFLGLQGKVFFSANQNLTPERGFLSESKQKSKQAVTAVEQVRTGSSCCFYIYGGVTREKAGYMVYLDR